MKQTFILYLLFIAYTLSAQTNIQWRGTDRSGIYKETGLLKSWPTEGKTVVARK